MNDLLFLVADKNMEAAVAGLLERDEAHHAIGCCPFDFDPRRDIKVAKGLNDPGLYNRASEILKPLKADYQRAVVIVDEEWEGSPPADAIESRLRKHLTDAGWTDETALPLVACPEADVWLWSDSPHSAMALGWSSWDTLRPALEQGGWLAPEQTKPARPKEAAEWALRHAERRMPRSSTIYRQVAKNVSLLRCEDGALARLLAALRRWFPQEVGA